MNYYIGVDAGGTKTSASSYDDKENSLSEVKNGPGNISVNQTDALNNIYKSIDDILKIEKEHNLKGIAMGIAGLPNDKKEEFISLFNKKYNVPIIIESDYMMAFKSTFKKNNGILVIAGTGVVMFGSYDEQTVKLGGWGHLLGDEGSGYDIVIRTIKHAIDLFEEKNTQAEVITELITAIGCDDFEGLKRYIYANEKSEIAKFAPLIVEKAKKGDPFVVSIINEVVDILYSKIKLISKKLGLEKMTEFSAMGGVLSPDSFVLELLLLKINSDHSYLKYIPSGNPSAAAVAMINNSIKEKSRYAVGLMSGTSLDGIDTVLCRVYGYDLKTIIDVVDFETYDYEKESLNKIEKIVSGVKVLLSDISELNVALGYEYAKAVKNICEKNNVDTGNLYFIASHGQTVFHEATGNKNIRRSTMQLGEPSIIAYETGAKVISNFRAKDMAAFGEGAPLVPKSELILYQDGYDKILLNIGGISNMTYLPNDGNQNNMSGFDTGPGNMMINEAVNYFYNKDYDNQGKIASEGKLVKPLLDELMSHWFISKKPPKSTGRDEFGKEYTLSLIKKYSEEKPEDIIKTMTVFTASSIAKHVKEIIQSNKNVDRLIVGGGGTYNLTLLKCIKQNLSDTKIEVLTQDEIGYSSDAKEAIAFVVLGNQTIHQRPGNIPNVTGAHKEVILGSITYPN
ncbi:anhydro-N-acetylmuramic acid kinase AnmK [Alkalibacterium sp. f15]|uniref:anhydro-N-acetylmuramic acid kinase AnmK n=1 Tax=Alkalibacterium sp. f15 TaxID=3414029 RepID=UPI003BF87C7D